MRNKNYKFIIGIIIGVIISMVTIVLADTIAASLVTYDNTLSGSSKTNVQGAIDDLYIIANSKNALQLVGIYPKNLSTTLVAGLYRYQGTTADNYICFGTKDKDTCIGTALVGTEDEADRYDRYMYRIIGVNSSGQMKLIKKEALNTTYEWHALREVEWPASDLKAGLNGSYFLTNTTYVPSGWDDRIATVDWHYWTGKSVDISAANMATAELGATTTSAKIGLMYLHDYYYGLPGGNNCSTSGVGDTCKTSWIFLWQEQNDSNSPGTAREFTISRYNTGNVWHLSSVNGYVNYGSMAYQSASTRPVFYLTSSQVIASGSGTLADPYILA